MTEFCRKSLDRRGGQSQPDQPSTGPLQAQSWSWVTKCNRKGQKHFPYIIYAISHNQLNGSRTSVSPAAPGIITLVIRSSILTSSTCSWWLNTIIMVAIRRVLITKITMSTGSIIMPPSLLRLKVGGQMLTITPVDPMKWESELERDFKFSLVHCLDHFDASLAIQSDLHNHQRW